MGNRNAAEVRSRSLRRLSELGFPEPPVSFPVLWESLPGYRVQPLDVLVERTGVVAMAVERYFGMTRQLAETWIDENGLRDALASEETALLADDASAERFGAQIESLWALAWLLRLHDDLDPSRYCGDSLAGLMPDLRAAECLSNWVMRANVACREADDVAEMLDLYYWLTWGLADANLNQRSVPGSVEQYVLWERRRALEFALVLEDEPWQHGDWYEISLDT